VAAEVVVAVEALLLSLGSYVKTLPHWPHCLHLALRRLSQMHWPLRRLM